MPEQNFARVTEGGLGSLVPPDISPDANPDQSLLAVEDSLTDQERAQFSELLEELDALERMSAEDVPEEQTNEKGSAREEFAAYHPPYS